MLDRLEIKNGAQDTNFQLCRLHIDLFHDDFWSGINNGLFLKKIKIMRGRPQGIVVAVIPCRSYIGTDVCWWSWSTCAQFVRRGSLRREDSV